MQMGPWRLIIIAIVVLVLFGRGKISSLMSEVGKGITAFKKGVKDSTAELGRSLRHGQGRDAGRERQGLRPPRQDFGLTFSG